jgi:hypothetical protein
MDSASSTPRRSARIQKISPPSSPSVPNDTPSKTPKMTARRSPYIPYLPTSLETILLSIYPATLVVGSLFALLDPAARAAPYNTVTQSHFASTAPSYFAKKSNVFNQYFVKQGWAWVTFSYFFFLFTHPSTGTPWTTDATPRRVRGAIRHAMVSLWWYFTTQWFFGPAIIDRGFRLTGGQCELVEAAEAGKVDMESGRQFVTGVACKAVGGKWRGGHDISGHVFLLVLGSMFLLEEVLHVVLKFTRAKEQRTVYMADGAVKSADVETDRHSDLQGEARGQWTLGAKVALGVAGLSLYMLLMTAAYFHTWFEKVSRPYYLVNTDLLTNAKFTGLIVALSGIFVVYFLPRAVPALRGIIGMPGI